MITVDYAPLVPFQRGQPDLPPIFLIPGAGAGVASFNHLTMELDAATPIWGFQPRGLDDGASPYPSVEAAAEQYVAALLELLPNGPVRLLGHSFGAWIAFDMALRLQAAGRRLDTLVLLDARAPAAGPEPHYDQVGALLKLADVLQLSSPRPFSLDRELLQRLSAEDRVALLQQRMSMAGLVSPRTPRSAIRAMTEVFRANINSPYLPTAAYGGQVALVLAADPLPARPDLEDRPADTAGQWRRHAPHIEVTQVAGNHLTMLSPPNTPSLAARLTTFWSR